MLLEGLGQHHAGAERGAPDDGEERPLAVDGVALDQSVDDRVDQAPVATGGFVLLPAEMRDHAAAVTDFGRWGGSEAIAESRA